MTFIIFSAEPDDTFGVAGLLAFLGGQISQRDSNSPDFLLK